ncbi:unnamed protein product [Owenia fusiformis]|uniref:Uncharacterized protein n=1 Tax=Owenia fusiformis TaxID=6347 RepID=A0A8J1UMW6_OWEFU|nr:unnamed protein product [Owenia fusiformis]
MDQEEQSSRSDVFVKSLANIVDREDIHRMVEAQKHMLLRFEKTNEMLLNFNALSVNRCNATTAEFNRHTQLLCHMKKELDSVFLRIRNIKSKLSTEYPEAFKACRGGVINEEDELVQSPGSQPKKSFQTQPQRNKSMEQLKQQHSMTNEHTSVNNVTPPTNKEQCVVNEEQAPMNVVKSSAMNNSKTDSKLEKDAIMEENMKDTTNLCEPKHGNKSEKES